MYERLHEKINWALCSVKTLISLGISLESDWGLHCSNKESMGLDQTGHMLMLICFCAKY